MTADEANRAPVAAEPYDPPLCDSLNCAKKRRGLHLATNEVLLECGDTSYWCDYAIVYSEQHSARHQPEFIAEVLKRSGEYANVAGHTLETTEGTVPMLDIVALAIEVLAAPYCVRCREVALIAGAAPIKDGPLTKNRP